MAAIGSPTLSIDGGGGDFRHSIRDNTSLKGHFLFVAEGLNE